MNAARWVGYLEHKTPERLGYFTANAGKGYCTIFAAMLREAQHVDLMGLPWCAVFVHAVVARPDLLGRAHPGCRVLERRMKRKGFWRGRDYRPRGGDLIFCSNACDGRVDHCGIVERCDGISVTSIDGNSVDPSGTFRPEQGGAVARRTRSLTDPRIVGFAAIGKILEG